MWIPSLLIRRERWVSTVFFAQAADLELSVRELSGRYITHVLESSDGNKAQAARRLGLAVRTLYRRGPAARGATDPTRED